MNTNFALLVIDMQLVAFDGKITPPITTGQQVLDNVTKLIDCCRACEMPVIFLQTCAYSGRPYSKDVHGWEIHPQVSPLSEELVVFKVNSSGFDNTNLHEVLGGTGVSGVVTCGIWSEGCVATTSLAALKLGYEVCVASDAHGTVRNSDNEANQVIAEQNDLLLHNKAKMMLVEEICAELSSASNQMAQ